MTKYADHTPPPTPLASLLFQWAMRAIPSARPVVPPRPVDFSVQSPLLAEDRPTVGTGTL